MRVSTKPRGLTIEKANCKNTEKLEFCVLLVRHASDGVQCHTKHQPCSGPLLQSHVATNPAAALYSEALHLLNFQVRFASVQPLQHIHVLDISMYYHLISQLSSPYVKEWLSRHYYNNSVRLFTGVRVSLHSFLSGETESRR